MKYGIGIDTSCYTTSIAVVDDKYDLITYCKEMLKVKSGKRGLRQSEALFQHIKNIPKLFKNIKNHIDLRNVKVVSVSSKPRNIKDSYMPVFLGGTGYADVISQTLDIPCFTYSHQENHIMAGIWSSRKLQLLKSNFLAFHISGGTTELLVVSKQKYGFKTEIIGGSKDLQAGQFIDRVGVSLGLPFPCGKHIEEFALKADRAIPVPVSTSGMWLNFSGAETHVQKLVLNKENEYSIALGALKCITLSVCEVIKAAVKKTGIKQILMIGGVCSNQIMKKYLLNEFENIADLYFALPEFSADNAVGTALIGINDIKNEVQCDE